MSSTSLTVVIPVNGAVSVPAWALPELFAEAGDHESELVLSPPFNNMGSTLGPKTVTEIETAPDERPTLRVHLDSPIALRIDTNILVSMPDLDAPLELVLTKPEHDRRAPSLETSAYEDTALREDELDPGVPSVIRAEHFALEWDESGNVDFAREWEDVSDSEDRARTGDRGCACGNPAEEPHPCPFRQDVWNDGETLCTCCDECAGNCADDI